MRKEIFLYGEIIYPITFFISSMIIKLRNKKGFDAFNETLGVIALYYIIINVFLFYKYYLKNQNKNNSYSNSIDK